MTKIYSGNPFTHEEHVRESVGRGECAWCGQIRTTLYRYDNRKPAFCNKGCYRSYFPWSYI